MSLLTLAPGARTFLDVGGNKISENPNALAFGQGGAHWYTLEGVPSQTFRAAPTDRAPTGTIKRSTRRESRRSAPMRSFRRGACRLPPW